MITVQLHPLPPTGLDWAQAIVTAHHYLHAPVDSRCSPLAYLISLSWSNTPIGCLIVGRPEATRCYDGALTYGSRADVHRGRAQYDRWEILNLARVWLSPDVQRGGTLYRSDVLPGYTDRRGVWRSTLASTAIGMLLARVGYDYLCQRPPCFPDEPYQIRVLLSYCDTRQHHGTIYQAAGFARARTNPQGIETWYSTAVAPLTRYQDDMIRKRAGQSWRSRRQRSRRAAPAQQEILL